jgi:hypothetical protein
VEVVVSRRSVADKTRHIVHFLNHYTAASGVFDRDAVPTLTDVGLWLNERRIGRACRMARVGDSSPAGVEREGNWVRVHVPQLGVHEIAIVETQPSGAMPAE